MRLIGLAVSERQKGSGNEGRSEDRLPRIGLVRGEDGMDAQVQEQGCQGHEEQGREQGLSAIGGSHHQNLVTAPSQKVAAMAAA